MGSVFIDALDCFIDQLFDVTACDTQWFKGIRCFCDKHPTLSHSFTVRVRKTGLKDFLIRVPKGQTEEYWKRCIHR